jgi:hypothetical protein
MLGSPLLMLQGLNVRPAPLTQPENQGGCWLATNSCLHRKVGRTVAAQDTVNIKSRLPTHVGDVDSVRHEAPGLDDGTKRVDGR